jgi:hypothetical protein
LLRAGLRREEGWNFWIFNAAQNDEEGLWIFKAGRAALPPRCDRQSKIKLLYTEQK